MSNELILMTKMMNVGATQDQIVTMRIICDKLSRIGKKSKQEIYKHTCYLIDQKAGKVAAEQSMKIFVSS